MRTLLLSLVVLIFFSCQKESLSPTQQNEPALGESFNLKMGESAAITGEQVFFRFAAVPEDSRCPEGARCLWEGNAAVVLQFPEVFDTINTSSQPNEVKYKSYTVSLKNLTPFPKVNVPRDTLLYVVQLVVTKE